MQNNQTDILKTILLVIFTVWASGSIVGWVLVEVYDYRATKNRKLETQCVKDIAEAIDEWVYTLLVILAILLSWYFVWSCVQQVLHKRKLRNVTRDTRK